MHTHVHYDTMTKNINGYIHCTCTWLDECTSECKHIHVHVQYMYSQEAIFVGS